MFRDFWAGFHRHKTSFILNILGLSLAFTTFYILMVQLRFEWGFDRFHRDADRIYRVERKRGGGETASAICFPLLYRIMDSSPFIEAGGIKAPTRWSRVVHPGDSTGQRYVRTGFSYVTSGYAKVFTFDMIEGAVDSLYSPEMAIIPLSLAEKLYGKRKSYLNETFGDNQSWFLRVGGVYRDFPKNSMIENIVYQVPNKGWLNQFLSDDKRYDYHGYLKLARGADIDRLLQKFPIDVWEAPEEETVKFSLRPLKDIYYCDMPSGDISIRGNRNVNRLLFSIAVLIVVIAGINFMNFSMALVPMKIKGINTQLVLGASVVRLRLSLLAEVLCLVFLSFLLSLSTVFLISRTSFAGYLDADMTLTAQRALVGLTLFIALVTGVLSSLYPIRYITSFPLARVVNGTFAFSSNGRLLRNGLIGLQFTISLIVVAVVMFMGLQNHYMQSETLGFDKDRIANIFLSHTICSQQSDAFIHRLKENPYIEEVAFTDYTVGSSDSYMNWGRSTSKGEVASFYVFPVSPTYLKVLGISVSEGRDFLPEDEQSRKGCFIFNETARRKFGLELGEEIGTDGSVIGFIPDIKFQSFRKTVGPMAFFVPGTDNGKNVGSCTAAIRMQAAAPVYATLRYIEEICRELDPRFQHTAYLYDEVQQRLYQREQKQYTLVSIFSLLIIFISVVGVFGLVVFETQARRKEVGIRKVFGSTEIQILGLFNKTYLWIVSICFVVSVPFSFRITDLWLQNFAYRIPIYWWVFLVDLLIVVVIVACTVTIRSWRTARENPVDAIGR